MTEKRARLTKDNPDRRKRDVQVATLRLQGKSFREIGKEETSEQGSGAARPSAVPGLHEKVWDLILGEPTGKVLDVPAGEGYT